MSAGPIKSDIRGGDGARRRRAHRGLAAALAMVTSSTGMAIASTGVAAAAPVYEITGRWIEAPDALASGSPVVADWRVNVNDDVEPPSNDPVENVVATFTVGNGEFAEIPDVCLTEGVDPVSTISDDGFTLTCNLGTVTMGTAVAVQTPVIADGPTGSEITLGGSIGGQEAEVPPIPIENPFLMDVDITNPTAGTYWNDAHTQAIVDLPWTLYLGRRSDPGPADVTIPLRLTASNGNPVLIGSDQRDGLGSGCVPRYTGNAGHPVSEGSSLAADRIAPFVENCELVAVDVATGRYDLVLTGIDYSGTLRPTKDSGGRPLPADRTAVATGTTWFRVNSDSGNGSIAAQVLGPPTYTAPTGQTSTDDPANNEASRAWVGVGGWTERYNPGYTGGPGESFANNYLVAAGTTVQQSITNSMGVGDIGTFPDDAPYGDCIALDTQWVTYDSAAIPFFEGNPGATPQFEYYTGNAPSVTPGSGSYNPDNFDCGIANGWTTTEPADKTTIKAVRIVFPLSTYDEVDTRPNGEKSIGFNLWTTIHDDAPQGQDVWTFGFAMRNGNWSDGADRDDFPCITPTPDLRYSCTKNGLDVLRIVTVKPAIEKSVEQATIVPGVPVGYTLTYSANGAGNVPPTVDDYQIVDTLPVSMTYVPGSADPEPVVTMSGGQQVLTWTLDGVTTNEPHELTYQSVADSSVEPGTGLRNTAAASYGGQESREVNATVTTTTNGHTTILKTSDVEYIPNVNGDGVGSGSWTVTIESFDPYAQAFTDTIDILPYNGDQRGTSFNGTYTLDDVVLPDGGTVYYTDADPATLTDDPADASNGAAGDPSGNTVGWSTTRPEQPTAIRVIGPELPSGGSFSFQVPITTNGAQPQDVYVNRAQARAEHTELVMRTSAALVVTDYTVEKSSDPEDGATVEPGDTITYTVTVTQEGPVPAGAVLSDDMTDVLDDATYNDDVSADIGTATFTDGVLDWEGTIPVGGTATITYSVTVKDASELEQGDSNKFLDNQVTSPGCVDEESCGTEHVLGYYTVSKTADPAPGETVGIGDVVTYHVQVIQKGDGAVTGAFLDDDLTGVLDDATWNDDAVASSGEVSYTEPTLHWSGDLAVGAVVDLTYSVTVTGDGDWQLHNVVGSVCADDDPDCLEGICVPAPDQNPDCQTTHVFGDYQVMKTSDPETGSTVDVGDVITYTVTATHIGIADVTASYEDDLSDVLDDATWNDDLAASAGEASFEEPMLSWSGELGQGDVATVTYSVTVTAEGNRHLENVVTTPGECVPAAGQDEACTTEHINGSYTYSKTSDPVPGSVVAEGDVITYTVLISQVGDAPVEGATVEDDLAAVLDDAVWNDDAAADSGEVSYEEPTLTWTGDLEVGQVVTLTYSVTANAVGEGDDELVNVVTDPTDEGVCVPAEDGNEGCTTDHRQGEYTYAKTSDPVPGSEVEAGDTVTYTITVTQVGAAAVEGAWVEDDLSQVADDATYNDDAVASSGEVSRDGTTLRWDGDLAVGQTVTITYSVTVTDDGDGTLHNVVTTDDDRGVCVEAADGNPECQTEHTMTGADTPPPPDDDPSLPDTGTDAGTVALLGGIVLLAGAAGVAVRRGRRHATGSSVSGD